MPPYYYQNNSTYFNPLKSGDALTLTSPIDPYWDNVVLYLKGDGENNSTNIIDSSPNPRTITKFGDVKISTAVDPTGSIYFDGSGDYLSINLDSLATFTCESLFIPNNDGRNLFFLTSGTTNKGLHIYNDANIIYINNGVVADFSSSTLILNQLNHLAVIIKDNSLIVFINGILITTKAKQDYGILDKIQIGRHWDGRAIPDYLGHLKRFRITVGERYTAPFNPEIDTYLN